MCSTGSYILTKDDSQRPQNLFNKQCGNKVVDELGTQAYEK
jgi:hypothetical protein